ncbi:MAG: nitrogenase component 1 [Euryarchaeota archaeon]|nr:nitrogenase component 1 [Euryarchaeota archaeon]
MMQVSVRIGFHKSVKRVGVDLVMGSSHGTYIADDEGVAFVRVGFPAYGQVECQRRVINGVWWRDRSC